MKWGQKMPAWVKRDPGKTRKLTDEQVDMIRLLIGVNQYELAAHFGVKQPTISEIQSGKRRMNGKEKEFGWFRKKEARSFTSAVRRISKGKDKVPTLTKKNRAWVEWHPRKKRAETHWTEQGLANAKAELLKYTQGPDHHYRRKMHCKNRHPLTGDNLYIVPSSGERLCRICIKERGRARYQMLKNRRKEECLAS